MISTRDFLLYLVVLLFLFVGIAYTLVKDGLSVQKADVAEVTFGDAQTVTVALDTEDSGNRSAYIQALKEKIADGAGQIIEGPAVFTSVDDVEEEEIVPELISRTVQRCPSYTVSPKIMQIWEPEYTEVRFVEGAHVVYKTVIEEVTVGSSTEEIISEVALLQLVNQRNRNAADSCLPSNVVGVTLGGQLILNTDVPRFRDATDILPFSYALDGFPIHGIYTGTGVLDSCGGINEGLGYQYHLRENESFILGCFAGTPSKLLQ